MPTSEPGTARRTRHPMGFTLVELLIVLAIIGLMSAVVVLAIPDPRGSLRAEAERFAARAKAAQDQAVIGARAMSVRVGRVGYGFDRREGAQWVPLDTKPFAAAQWSEGTEAMVEGETRLVFDATGISDPAQLVLARDEKQLIVEFHPDGKVDIRG